MPTITVKNISAKLHKTLKHRAAMFHRSLNNEIIASLEAATGLAPIDTRQMAIDAGLAQKLFKGMALPEDIDRFKKEGRS